MATATAIELMKLKESRINETFQAINRWVSEFFVGVPYRVNDQGVWSIGGATYLPFTMEIKLHDQIVRVTRTASDQKLPVVDIELRSHNPTSTIAKLQQLFVDLVWESPTPPPMFFSKAV